MVYPCFHREGHGDGIQYITVVQIIVAPIEIKTAIQLGTDLITTRHAAIGSSMKII
jgi:hypothetical protein